jgi:hypothetical protein
VTVTKSPAANSRRKSSTDVTDVWATEGVEPIAKAEMAAAQTTRAAVERTWSPFGALA